MPTRHLPLTTGLYYHLFNRGVNRTNIFFETSDYRRATDLLRYYQHDTPPVRYSHFQELPVTVRGDLWQRIVREHPRCVEMVAYCFMPNHFHFLIKQRVDGGISQFAANWQNSFAKYLNTKYDRVGPLFQGPFRAVRVTNDAQLVHLSRYIHLNPYTGSVVKTIQQLLDYPWSSLPDYLSASRSPLSQPDLVLSQFTNTQAYKKFMVDRADYQRSLEQIRHLSLE